VFPSNDPAVFTRIDLGANLSSNFASNVKINADSSVPPTIQTFKRGAGSATFTVGYGLPGKPDYSYTRPFDYFNFEAVFDSSNAVESVFRSGPAVWHGLRGRRQLSGHLGNLRSL